jgi:hypothetical protein
MAASAQNARRDRDLRLLAKWMTGSWDTFAQVDDDEEKDARYRHARAILHVLTVEVAGLGDGFALYVENQQAEARTKPYRQRVYFLTRSGGVLTVRIFRISEPADLINAHKRPGSFARIERSRLTLEKGCDLRFERSGRRFKGRLAEPVACSSSLRGATHTYSESEIGPDVWINLDQGFDDAGNHKWGPPPGTIGHMFRRRR